MRKNFVTDSKGPTMIYIKFFKMVDYGYRETSSNNELYTRQATRVLFTIHW